MKVYRLNDEGQWDDRGTGRVSLAGARVLVVSEGDRSEVLLASAPRGPESRLETRREHPDLGRLSGRRRFSVS